MTVSAADAASFQAVRRRLFGIAYRVLGSATEANDVVQDAWIRWQRTDRSRVRDSDAFLATTTTRLAINVRRSARVNHETSIGLRYAELADDASDPSLGVERRERLEVAVRTLLEKLSPSERAVYLLREAFGYPYQDIAAVLPIGEANARKLATRARERLSADYRRPVRSAEQDRLLHAFDAAAQTGDVAALEELLAADLVDRTPSTSSDRGDATQPGAKAWQASRGVTDPAAIRSL